MAQPQSHPSLPTPGAPAFSPPTSQQQSPSPTPTSAAFALPPNKRPKLSPAPSSQPQSPYNAYAPSPGATGASPVHTPSSAAPSPQFAGVPLPTPTTATTPNAIAAPAVSTPPTVSTNPNPPQGYTNGNTAVSTPDAHASQLSPPMGSAAPAPYTAATMAPIAPQPSGAPLESPATPGSMAPPTRPPDRPTKEYEYEPTDMLAGTGIDLRHEEQLAAEMLLNSQDIAYGFPQYPAGSRDTFHGAGGMNQSAEHLKAQSQDELAAIAAKKAWDAASRKLAAARSQELNSPFMTASVVHRKLEKLAKDQGLELHLDYKNAQNTHDRRRIAEDQPPPQVKVSTKTLPDGTIVTTSGSYVAQETFLADQLSLLSLACKQRMRNVTEEAFRLSTNRQESSHGQIPDEWADIAAPLPGMAAVEEETAAVASGEATDGDANSRKRSQSAANLDPVNGLPVKLHKIEKNETISTMREVTRVDRDWEEARLRRRNARTEGAKDSATPSRAGSVAPGTPGATPADTPSKKETKKEQRKAAASKAAEASNHASQNITSSMFVGKAGGLFGKKKYDWMNPKGRSGASTPARAGTPGAGGAPGGAPGGGAQAENMPLTTESRTRLGNWREDREKGRGIQLRDWIAALEADGVDGAVLQKAYDKLDTSGPR